jgi:hypothetical protein
MSKRGNVNIRPEKPGFLISFLKEILGQLFGAIGALVITFLFFSALVKAWDIASYLFASEPTHASAAPPAAYTNQPSKQYFRAFTSADRDSKLPPILLGGQNYNLKLFSATVGTLYKGTTSPERTFIADYDNGTFIGDFDTAEEIIIKGNVNLAINDISEIDTFKASFTQTGKNISAYIDYAQSPQGPPSRSIHKNIVILGEIREIQLPSGGGNSRSDIRIMAMGDDYWKRSNDSDSSTANFAYTAPHSIPDHKVKSEPWHPPARTMGR